LSIAATASARFLDRK